MYCFSNWFFQKSYNHNTSFKNESKKNNTTLAKYICDLKFKLNVTPKLKRHILKSVARYSNITKKCRLCLQEKFEILSNLYRYCYLMSSCLQVVDTVNFWTRRKKLEFQTHLLSKVLVSRPGTCCLTNLHLTLHIFL